MAKTENPQETNAQKEDKPLVQSTLEEIARKAAPRLVEISDFYGDEESITVRLRNASLLQLAVAGSIPNELMSTVNRLYKKGLNNAETDVGQQGQVLLHVAEAALVAPTMKELEEKGVTLTERQLTEIYIFVVNGVRALKDFRKIPEFSRPVPNL